MKIRKNKSIILSLCILSTFLVSPASTYQAKAADGSGYRLIKESLIGGEGGWDDLSVDSSAQKLFISHTDHVEVMNIKSGKVEGTVKNTAGIHCIALIPSLGKGFTSNGKKNTTTVFDLKTLKVLSEIKTGDKPDSIIYDSFSKKIFAFNGNSQNVTVIDPVSYKVKGTIALGGGPEFSVSDGKGSIYLNLEDKSEVLKINAKAMKIEKRWKLKPGEEPSGIALDKKNNVLFSACHNNLMVIMNTNTGKIIDTLPIGSGVDGAAFDPETNFAFSSNGEGTITVIHEDSPEKFHVVENVKTEKGARTMTLDLKTHHIFLPTAKFGEAPAPTKEKPHPRPQILPGTFKILEYGIK